MFMKEGGCACVREGGRVCVFIKGCVMLFVLKKARCGNLLFPSQCHVSIQHTAVVSLPSLPPLPSPPFPPFPPPSPPSLPSQHHCRKCGSVVCGGCSTQHFLLPQISSKPLCVCDRCYDKLSATQAPKEE